VKSRALLNGSKRSVALPASIGWRSDYGLCGPRFSSGNLAMFTATRRGPVLSITTKHAICANDPSLQAGLTSSKSINGLSELMCFISRLMM
jgi:hypothetical protein